MDGEANILQNRVQVAAFRRRWHHPQEGIGGQHDEQDESGGNPALNGQHIGFQSRRQITAEDGDQRAEQREDE